MLDVFLLRHGQTQWNADGNRYCGRTDIPLTDVGVRQAETVRRQLGDVSFDGVYSSPLQRAYTTAQLACNGKHVIKDERLIEADFGRWEGKTKEEFIEEDPESWREWMEHPLSAKAGGSGETGSEIIRRVDDFFRDVHDRHRGGSILVVAHNGINRLYLAFKLGMDVKHYRRIVQENSSVTLFSLDDKEELTLKLLNSKGI